MADKFDALATYNAECYRGIVHTPEKDAEMAILQREFNETTTFGVVWQPGNGRRSLAGMARSWLRDWQSTLALILAAFTAVMLHRFTGWSWVPVIITAIGVFCATAFLSGFTGGLVRSMRADPERHLIWAMAKQILCRR